MIRIQALARLVHVKTGRDVKEILQAMVATFQAAKLVEYFPEEGARCPICGAHKVPVTGTRARGKGRKIVRSHSCRVCFFSFQSYQAEKSPGMIPGKRDKGGGI
jgi:rubredoxin